MFIGFVKLEIKQWFSAFFSFEVIKVCLRRIRHQPIKMILTMNNFSFNNEHYLQKHGKAMRTRMAPSYANLFMGKFDIMIWTRGEEHLKTFIGYLNSIHPSIKFTHEYSSSLHQTLPFLECPSSSHYHPFR